MKLGSSTSGRKCWAINSRPTRAQAACKEQSDIFKRKPERPAGANQGAIAQIARLKLKLAKCEDEREHLRAELAKQSLAVLCEIVRLTTSLFGRGARVFESRDPEFPEDTSIVFSVEVPFDPKQIVQAEGEWTKQLSKIVPHAESISLLIYPK